MKMLKTALITGAAKRIGKAIVNQLAYLGWNVIVYYNTSEKSVKLLIDSLKESFPDQRFEAIKANLDNMEEVENLIPTIFSEWGPFNLLVNNASVFEKAGIAETSVSFFERQINVNLKAPFILCRDFATYCKSGNIINLVDTRIVTNKPEYAAYSLSKKGLWELTKMAAIEFGPEIRVNAIAPGATLPPVEKDAAYLQKLAVKTPMKTPGGIEPVLKSIDFILNNNYLTGQLLFADGGENVLPCLIM